MRIKANQTIAGYYGRLEAGAEATLEAGTARELAKAGLVDILDEDAKEEPIKEGRDMSTGKNGPKAKGK